MSDALAQVPPDAELILVTELLGHFTVSHSPNASVRVLIVAETEGERVVLASYPFGPAPEGEQ